MADSESQSPSSESRKNPEPIRQYSDPPQLETLNSDANNDGHIVLDEPRRPQLSHRKTSKSVSDALRLARSREEQETLLGDEECADDDGCFPPRTNDEPRIPNPHRNLPIYATIHKIRRLVIASIGVSPTAESTIGGALIYRIQMIHTVRTS